MEFIEPDQEQKMIQYLWSIQQKFMPKFKNKKIIRILKFYRMINCGIPAIKLMLSI